jgi:3-oxoacyl-[acyl-carrier-protein] synthase-3
MMTGAAEQVIASSGLNSEEIDLFIPHQANMRIIESTAKRLGLAPDKVFANVDRYGNTSAASIPIALCEALDKGLIKVGDNVVLTSFGAGLSWAAVALRWSAEIPERLSPWVPFRQTFETRVAAVRSALRRQKRRVGTVIDETLHRDS